jgi:enoyl-CoA hydratase/carnithine racemase
LGDIFTALKAYDTGIVSDVLEPEALDAHVQAQVKKLLDLPLTSLLTTKRLMKSVTKSAVSEKMAEEGHLFMSMIPQAPAQEAFKAFGEKRAPNFKQFEN